MHRLERICRSDDADDADDDDEPPARIRFAGAALTFTCHQLQFQLDVTDPNTSPIDNNQDTQGAVLVSVGVPGNPATNRLIVVPITVKTTCSSAPTSAIPAG